MIIIAEVSELSRKIKLPTDRVLSVNGDYQVDGIAFKLPATYDGDFDFSTAAARVHWTGVDKVEHTNLITEVDGNGYPLWTMPSELTQGGHGVIEFAVSFVATDETAAVTKRWISDPVSFRNRRTVNGSNEDEEAEEETTYDRLASAIATVRAAQAEVEDTNAVLSSLTGSAPVPVENRSDMVDDGHLYLYTGDETGLVTGNLYYYVNGTLTNGGQYGSMEVDATLTQSGQAADAKKTGDEISAIKEDLSTHEVRITELEDGGSGGLSKTAVNLLNTILSEAVYGSDQTANIELLKKELSNVAPVSISAILDGTALAGQSYSELSFIVTATFDDDSTAVVDKYTVITTGTVKTGSNTVTIKYRGVTTTCTFNAEQVTTYTITNDLTNATTSNNTSVVVENDRYTSEITIESGYDVSVFTVTMGGVDVTATVKNGNNIVIDSVTGDVVITVTAVTPAYLDPLIRMRGGFDSVAYLCPDNHVSTAIRINNALSPMVSEYPAQNDCTITYRIENNTGESVPVNNLGFALLSGADSDWVTKNEYPYYSKVAIPIGESLAPGEYIEGTYLWKAGYQIVCTTILSNIGKLDIKLKGAYVPVKYDEDDSYDKYVLNSETQHVFHAYATQIDWYADDSTSLANKKMSTLYYITDNLSSGTYDLVFRLRNHNIGTSSGLSYLSLAAGTVNELTESTASIYNSFASGRTAIENVWMYKRVTVAPGNNILVPSSGITNLGINDKLFEFFFKEVSA